MKPTPSPANSVVAEVDSPVGGDFGLAGGEVRRRQIVVKAFAVGLVAGLLGAGFRVALEWSESLRTRSIHSLPGWRGALLAVAIGSLGAGSATWLVQSLAPHALGSGIPWLKSVLLGERHPEWRRLLPVKFLAGLIGIGSGLALGREGPTVQMGGAAGAMVGQFLGVQNEQERRALISAGAGAGLAAGFNAPLSGLIFVLEELHGSFTPVVFVAAFLASVTGDVVTRLLVSERPVFHINVAAPGIAARPGLRGSVCSVALWASFSTAPRFRGSTSSNRHDCPVLLSPPSSALSLASADGGNPAWPVQAARWWRQPWLAASPWPPSRSSC